MRSYLYWSDSAVRKVRNVIGVPCRNNNGERKKQKPGQVTQIRAFTSKKKKKKKSFNKKLDKLKKKTALEKSKRHKKVLVKKSCP